MARWREAAASGGFGFSNQDRPDLFKADFGVVHHQHGAVHRAKVHTRQEALGVHLVPCPVNVRHSNPPAYEWFDFLDGHPAIRAVPLSGSIAPGIIGGLVPAFQNLTKVRRVLHWSQDHDEVVFLQFGVALSDEPMFATHDPYDVAAGR
jgi:hypothetical protein